MHLGTGIKVSRLVVPFQGEASVQDISVNPDVSTRVEDVGVEFGVEVCTSGHNFISRKNVEQSQSDTW